MRALLVPLIAVGVVFTGYGDEPSERQMQLAFQDALSLQVRNAIEFADETGGAEAVAQIRRNGTDRFTVNAFQKVKCQPQFDIAGHRCHFRVDIGLANGNMERQLTGHFHGGFGRLVFADEI